MRSLSLVVLLFAATSSAQMLNDDGPPQHRFIHRSLLALRVNPLGAFLDLRFAYRFRLYKSSSTALRDNFISFGVTPQLSPAFVRVGPYVEVAPASFLSVWASFSFVQYLGTFDLFQSFPGAGRSANGLNSYSDAAIRERGKSGDPATDNYLTNGSELTLGVDLQAKVSSIVVRSRTKIVRADMKLRDGDRVYYDQMYDQLMPNGGFTWNNDFDVLWQGLENKLLVGARYSLSVPFYRPQDFAPGETAENLNAHHRVGPFAGYTFFSKDGAAFNNPTVFLLVQWWLVHRYRAGQEVSQALPLIGAGFQITGDFLPLK